MMRPSEMFPLVRRTRPTMVRGIREGLSYARHSRTVLVILGMMVVFASLCFNFSILLPVLAKQTLDSGPRTFGVLSASFGIGALVGALAAAAVSRASWRTMFVGAIGFAVCELAIAPVRSMPVDAVLLFVCGIFFTSYTANSNSRIQLDTPDHLRGRVLALLLRVERPCCSVVSSSAALGDRRHSTCIAVVGTAGLAMAITGALAARRGPHRSRTNSRSAAKSSRPRELVSARLSPARIER
jgi:sugar phosphate permease